MSLTLLWSRRLQFDYLSIAAGTPFSAKACRVLVGSNNGIIFMFTNGTDPPVVFETKGGAVCQILLHNITKLHTTDLIVGDSGGSVLVFSKEQLLSRARLPYRVTALAVYTDGLQNKSIVAGDAGGTVRAFLPFEQHWGIALSEQVAHKQPRAAMLRSNPGAACVKALLNVQLVDDYGTAAHYVAVADTSQFIHFLQDGHRVFSMEVPCPPETMCFGRFVAGGDEEDAMCVDTATHENGDVANGHEAKPEKTVGSGQIMFAGGDGNVYMVHNYKVHHYAFIGYPITQMLCLQTGGVLDQLVCTGSFDGVKIVDQGKVTMEHRSPDWVYCMALGDVDGDSKPELILGLANHTLEVWKFPDGLGATMP